MQGGGRGGARWQLPQANPESARPQLDHRQRWWLGGGGRAGSGPGLSAILTRGNFTTCRLLGGVMIGCGPTASARIGCSGQEAGPESAPELSKGRDPGRCGQTRSLCSGQWSKLRGQ